MNAEISATFRNTPATPQNVSMQIALDKIDETAAAQIAALFPKSAKVTVSEMTAAFPGQSSYSLVVANANLTSNDINGGKNETGIKRYRSWMKALESAGIAVTFKTHFVNNYASREEFEAAIG